MIRIAIVDDEEEILDLITNYVSEFFSSEAQITSFSSCDNILEDIFNLSCDLILLDIEMPDIDGFSIAKAIKEIKPKTDIIFISNCEQLVFESFKYEPFRFVRKSCLTEDILPALQSYKTRFYANNECHLFEFDDGNEAILVNEIIYFESMGHEIYIKTVKKKLKLKRKRMNGLSMKDIELTFEKKGFIRVHKSYIVNAHQIYRINRESILLKNEEKININPHKVNDIKNAFQRFIMMGD